MKKQTMIFFVLVIAVAFCQEAMAQGPYVRGSIGGAYLTDSDVTDSTLAPGVGVEFESDMGYAAALAMGYEYNKYCRMELEFAYQTNDLDETVFNGTKTDLTGETYSMALLVNAYLDFANSSDFTPFITVGAGGAIVEVDSFSVSGTGVTSQGGDDTVFAYQVGAGISYKVNKRTHVDLSYRYFATADLDIDTAEMEYASHNVYIGIRLDY